MKVLIVTTMALFSSKSCEEQAQQLEKNLIVSGHDAEILYIPFTFEKNIPHQMLMIKALELYNIDLVIAFNFPAYLIRHQHKIIWIMEQNNLHNSLQQLIERANYEAFIESKRIFTTSEWIQQQIKLKTGIESNVLLVPNSTINAKLDWSETVEILLQ